MGFHFADPFKIRNPFKEMAHVLLLCCLLDLQRARWGYIANCHQLALRRRSAGLLQASSANWQVASTKDLLHGQ